MRKGRDCLWSRLQITLVLLRKLPGYVNRLSKRIKAFFHA